MTKNYQNSKMIKMQEVMERPERRRREGRCSVRFAFRRRSSLFLCSCLFLVPMFAVGLCVLWVLCGPSKATARCYTSICDGIIVACKGLWTMFTRIILQSWVCHVVVIIPVYFLCEGFSTITANIDLNTQVGFQGPAHLTWIAKLSLILCESAIVDSWFCGSGCV